MKPVLLVLLAVVGVIALQGMGMLVKGSDLPVYTDPDAVARLDLGLMNLPRDQRFERWYRELPRYETAHKQLTDTGRGLISLAAGILLGSYFLYLLGRTSERRSVWLVWTYWTLLWAIKFPLTMWYYVLRYERRDYPSWGDSFVIGVMQEWMAWAVGFVVFTVLLRVLMTRHGFPRAVRFSKPRGRWGWTRAITLWLWIALLLVCGFPAIGEGDEGMVLSCMGAVPVLLLALAAIGQRCDEPVLAAADLPTDCKVQDSSLQAFLSNESRGGN